MVGVFKTPEAPSGPEAFDAFSSFSTPFSVIIRLGMVSWMCLVVWCLETDLSIVNCWDQKFSLAFTVANQLSFKGETPI